MLFVDAEMKLKMNRNMIATDKMKKYNINGEITKRYRSRIDLEDEVIGKGYGHRVMIFGDCADELV